MNHEVTRISTKSDIFVFSFILVENELALQETKFKFVVDIFVQALKERRNLALSSIFMDSTHRLWPRIINRLAQEHARLGEFYFVPGFRRQLCCPRNAMIIVYPNGDDRLETSLSNSIGDYMRRVGFSSSSTTLLNFSNGSSSTDTCDEAMKCLELFQRDSNYQQAWRKKNGAIE